MHYCCNVKELLQNGFLYFYFIFLYAHILHQNDIVLVWKTDAAFCSSSNQSTVTDIG